MKIPKVFVPENNGMLDKKVEGWLMQEQVSDGELRAETGELLGYTSFEVIKVDTYAKGIVKLKRWRERLFTFKENVEARIIDENAKGLESKLFATRLDSITGVAYKAGSTKFKIIPRCGQLENINPYFNESFISINYNALQGIELDSSDKNVKYNQYLIKDEVIEHPGWLAAVNGDKEQLKAYADLWFKKSGMKAGMDFCVRGNTDKDELRALILGFIHGSKAISIKDINYSEDTNCILRLGYASCFLLGTT